MGPLSAVPDSRHRYLVTFTNRMKNCVEANPVLLTKADVISDAFVKSWFTRVIVSSYKATGRGSQFEGELFECLANTTRLCQLRTTLYYPRPNCHVEQLHKTCKEALKSPKKNLAHSLAIFSVSNLN